MSSLIQEKGSLSARGICDKNKCKLTIFVSLNWNSRIFFFLHLTKNEVKSFKNRDTCVSVINIIHQCQPKSKKMAHACYVKIIQVTVAFKSRSFNVRERWKWCVLQKKYIITHTMSAFYQQKESFFNVIKGYIWKIIFTSFMI